VWWLGVKLLYIKPNFESFSHGKWTRPLYILITHFYTSRGQILSTWATSFNQFSLVYYNLTPYSPADTILIAKNFEINLLVNMSDSTWHFITPSPSLGWLFGNMVLPRFVSMRQGMFGRDMIADDCWWLLNDGSNLHTMGASTIYYSVYTSTSLVPTLHP